MSHPIIKYKYSSKKKKKKKKYIYIYIYIYIYKSKICNSKKQYEALKSCASAVLCLFLKNKKKMLVVRWDFVPLHVSCLFVLF